MSKIKAKDLSYDAALPPFLQRLHDQKAGRGDTDRHERPTARPQRTKDPNDDDGPTLVDDSGEMVSREEYEKLAQAAEVPEAGGSVNGDGKGEGAVEVSGAIPAEEERRGDVKAATAVGGKKRKAAKVVGDDDHGDAEESRDDVKKSGEKSATTKPKKKKAKPIKLAFDDAEEGG